MYPEREKSLEMRNPISVLSKLQQTMSSELLEQTTVKLNMILIYFRLRKILPCFQAEYNFSKQAQKIPGSQSLWFQLGDRHI